MAEGWKTSLFGRPLQGTEAWNDVQKARANQMVMQKNPATGKNYRDNEIVEAINADTGSAQKDTLADLDRKNTENGDAGQFYKYGGPQAAAEARHGAREAGASEGDAINAGREAGMATTAANGAKAIGTTLAAGSAALGGLNVATQGVKAIPKAAMAAAPLLMGGSSEIPPESPPAKKEPEYNKDGWYQDESGKWIPGPNAKYKEETAAAPPAGAEPPPEQPAAEAPPAVKAAGDELDKAAPTPEEKNSLGAAAKRVLGLTGDKKKDAMKWLALSVSAAAHGWRGEPSPLVQAIMDDYTAKRQQGFSTDTIGQQAGIAKETREDTQEFSAAESAKARDFQAKHDKEMAALQKQTTIDLGWVSNDQQLDATTRLLAKIKEDPDGWAQLVRAQQGVGFEDRVAKWVGIGTQTASAILPYFLMRR